MSNDSTVYVGMDVHKDSIVVAYSIGFGEVGGLGNIGVLDRDIDRLCTRMQSKACRVVFVYEAGPCGYRLQRYLARKGFERSEEHTSELQSLMRISYAVFCSKKNTTTEKLPRT